MKDAHLPFPAPAWQQVRGCLCGHSKSLHRPSTRRADRAGKHWHTGSCTYVGCACAAFTLADEAAA